MPDSPEQQPGKPGWHRWSGRLRQQSHAKAHDEAPDGPPPVAPEHELIPPGEPVMITDQPALAELIEHIRATGTFGYDSEFIGEHSYHPKLCLIQIGTNERLALIDPLVQLDLTPLWQLLCDESLRTLVHAGKQDLEPAVRSLEDSPRNIFDTQVAAAFAGLPYPASLGKLIEAATGVNVGRGLKFSQWDTRPLSPRQKHYAADDVRYLPLLHEFIGEKLDALGNRAWAEEECATLCDLSDYGFDVRAMRGRVRGAGSLDRRGQAVLDALLEWRDEAAREFDMPPRTLLKDPVLLDLSRTPATSEAMLANVRGIPRPVRDRWGKTLIEITNETLAEIEPLEGEEEPPLPPPSKSTVNRLWSQIVEQCEPRSIDPAMVTSKRELGRMVSRHAVGRTLRRTPLRHGWRKQLLSSLLDAYLEPSSNS